MQNNKILGYKRFRNKENVERLVVDVIKTPTQFERDHGAVGMKAEQIWIPADFFDKFNEGVVGKIIDCQYEVNGRYANIIGVSFK